MNRVHRVAEARVLGLLLVIDQILDERLVLHRRVVDLAFEKIDAAVHVASVIG